MSDSAPDDIYRKIVLLMMCSKRHLSKATETYNMTFAQGMLLMLFESKKGTSMQNLSCMMGCDASNITGLVERLDNQGIIKRTVDPQDGRVKLIELSAKGLTRRDMILKELRMAEAADLQKLSSEEKTVLLRIIDKITAKQ